MLRTLSVLSFATSAAFLMVPAASANGLSLSSRDTFERMDNIILPVEATSGSCPSTVELWQESAVSYEAGDHSGLMLNVVAIAQGNTEFIDSQEYSVTFRSPLKPEFYSCVAYLGNDANFDEIAQYYRKLYDIWFSQGHVYFRLDISPIAPEPHERDWYYANITHQEIVGQYPYVRWAVGD
ncbi:MAG: hypothetical protein AAF821_02555 [Cyanobacteria bacterium P01_D01_bin.156]